MDRGGALFLKILVEGRPGAGKTTVVKRVVQLLRAAGTPVAGFITEEIREEGRRVGFAVESLGGERGVLAHVQLRGPPRVGKYGVDLETFERIALPALQLPAAAAVVVVDELGKMELASGAFLDAISELFDGENSLLATVHVFHHPFTDALKRRPDVETVHLREAQRDDLPALLARRLVAS